MTRDTVDFGIDLGTTNSSIAVIKGMTTEVIKNNDNQEITPSVVWIRKDGRILVGRGAEDQKVRDYEYKNVCCAFKRLMGGVDNDGKPIVLTFASSGRQMTPEELSAEVLKSLRGDVQQRMNEEATTAVIGVPAAFDLAQCAATEKAAQLANISYRRLIQEPIAAALAYGFQSVSENVFWLVYDLGGGTFDAAIIQVKEGSIQVVNHGGDTKLGGKDIDQEIVEQLLVPSIVQEYKLKDFTGDNKKWELAFAKLKWEAEKAKIRLSRDTLVTIMIDNLFKDKDGNEVSFEYELKRSEIEPLIEPYIERSINICKKVLREKNLSSGDIEKMILVGGPTLTPIVRSMLSNELGIALEYSIDPLTVVARGAAIFAGTQRIPKKYKKQRPVSKKQYEIELHYEPIHTESEPEIGGKLITHKGENAEGFTIEIIESKSQWRSGLITLGEKGTFIATLFAEKGRINEFIIELKDKNGTILETEPGRFSYIIGSSVTSQTMIHSIGVATYKNEMDVFIEKGTPLPARKRKKHITTVELKKGDPNTVLRIPVVEGENIKRADRNLQIGYLILSGDEIHRNLPLSSDVDITIDIDESRLVKARAYIDALDEEIEDIMKLGEAVADSKQLSKVFEIERNRLANVQQRAKIINSEKANEILGKIKKENTVHDIESSLRAASDSGEAGKCQKRLVDLRSAIDEAEDILMWPELLRQAYEELDNTHTIIYRHGRALSAQNLEDLDGEIVKAIRAHDADLLRLKMEELAGLRRRTLMKYPDYWKGFFSYLVNKEHLMKDQAKADRLIAKGQQAQECGDSEALAAIVYQLLDLLPPDEQQKARDLGGTTKPAK